MPSKNIETVLEKHTDRIMEVPGVIGVAQGIRDDKPCILILATALTPEIQQEIPADLEGFKVDIQITGEIRAL